MTHDYNTGPYSPYLPETPQAQAEDMPNFMRQPQSPHSSTAAMQAGQGQPQPVPQRPNSVRIDLSKPIEAHGDTVTFIELREPLGSDIQACGFPIKFSADPETNECTVTFIGQIMSKVIARCANIPTSSVGQMTFNDWSQCAGAINGFLQE